MTKPMTAARFIILSGKDFENGAVQNEIYIALKQRDEMLEHLAWIINNTLNNVHTRIEEVE